MPYKCLMLLCLALCVVHLYSQDEVVTTFDKLVDNGSRINVVASSVHLIDFTVKLEGTLENMVGRIPLPAVCSVQGKSREVIDTFNAADEDKPYLYTIHGSATCGAVAKVVPQPFTHFRFPFNGLRTISQGPHGAFSHHSGNSVLAYDFLMPEGTPVLAARSGMVVGLRDDIVGHGPDGNFILIRHEDMSYGEYVHFRFHGVVVKLGDTVQMGQQIGWSGDTGFSTAPHLHFGSWYINKSAEIVCLPLRFKDESVAEPKAGDVVGIPLTSVTAASVAHP